MRGYKMDLTAEVIKLISTCKDRNKAVKIAYEVVVNYLNTQTEEQKKEGEQG